VTVTLAAATICTAAAGNPKQAQTEVQKLQQHFDNDANAVSKAKLIQKLGDAQFEEARAATRGNNFELAGLIFEKYRDNVRAALDALKKSGRNAERKPAGYKELQMHVEKALRELRDTLLVAPAQYQPPLQIVQKDLNQMNDELLAALFPGRPGEAPPAKKPDADDAAKPQVQP
jgi:hypothetical protein